MEKVSTLHHILLMLNNVFTGAPRTIIVNLVVLRSWCFQQHVRVIHVSGVIQYMFLFYCGITLCICRWFLLQLYVHTTRSHVPNRPTTQDTALELNFEIVLDCFSVLDTYIYVGTCFSIKFTFPPLCLASPANFKL